LKTSNENDDFDGKKDKPCAIVPSHLSFEGVAGNEREVGGTVAVFQGQPFLSQQIGPEE